MHLTTSTGRCIDVFNMKESDICILDIAHSLSNLCRFGGHAREFYSVAQHSVRVAMALPARLRFVGLMHDATEAYICDLVRPIKIRMPMYELLEQQVRMVISCRYGLPISIPPEVKVMDDRALWTEFRELMTYDLPSSTLYPEMDKVTPLPYQAPLPATVARDLFIAVFTRYCGDTVYCSEVLN